MTRLMIARYCQGCTAGVRVAKAGSRNGDVEDFIVVFLHPKGKDGKEVNSILERA